MGRRIFATVFIVLVFVAAAVGAPAPKSKNATVKADTVTYVGCLRADDDGDRYMLTEISGPNAPRSRSWKTGFITKRSVDMEVSGPRGKMKENNGRLVRITGRRDGNELFAKSITFAGATCR